MAAEFLHCCICPRQPDFSDTSHLLTHVSSKGHLSHLHKLQVRSHQEIAAGYQLTVYNEWYLNYNVAQLLSERMQHKETKQAKKRANKQRRRKSTDQNPEVKVDPSLMTTKLEGLLEQADSAHGYSPVCNIEQSQDIATGRQLGYAPRDLPKNCDVWPAPPTPEVAKLKGIIWPGMDIFDSADQETQRKRNQRKDGSILGKMQTMSSLIEPTETVHSPGGTFKKKRHIDDIEDDSPVEGENPVVKHPSRRRKPLSLVDKNIARTGLGKTRRAAAPQATTTPDRHIHRKSYRSTCDQPASLDNSHRAAVRLWRHDSDSDYHWGDLATFSDTSSDLGNMSTAMLSNSFLESARACIQPELSPLVGPLWLQPSPQIDGSCDFFRDYRTPTLYAESHMDQENLNPLRWGKASRTIPADSIPTTLGMYDEYDGSTGSLADVYAFTRNPLSDVNPDQKTLPFTPQNRLSTRS